MSALQEIALDIKADVAANARVKNVKEPGVLSTLIAPFHRLTIGKKISFFFGINLGFALLAGLYVVAAFIEIGDQSSQSAQIHRSAFIAERLVAELSEAQRNSESFSNTDDQARVSVALLQLDRSLKSLDELGALAGYAETPYSQTLTSITDAVIEYKSQFEDAATDGLSGPIAINLGETALEDARLLAERIESEAIASSNSSYDTIIRLLAFWVALAGVLVLLTLGAQRFFDRHVGAALSSLADQMSQLSSGKEITDIEATSRPDEIGEMTRAMVVFHKAGMRLERLARQRSQKAQEDLERQALLQEQQEEARRERERTLRKIADDFERKVADVVTQVASASSQLQSTAASMAASADQASTRTSEVTDSMQEAHAGATAAAAASDEFAMSINEVSSQAASSAMLARQATASTHEADATISKLSESAEKVGHIVELIQTIAQRTNLLALNASIEAARGGEAGRGFAVVASEVKELAMQTSRATEEVALLVRAMQDTTGASVAALRSIATEVADLESVSISIASAVDQQSYGGQDLARSIDMAARGTEQVAEHIQEVRELSTTTGVSASQVLSSATALEQQAATLRAQVDSFLEEVRAA